MPGNLQMLARFAEFSVKSGIFRRDVHKLSESQKISDNYRRSVNFSKHFQKKKGLPNLAKKRN